jgi:hypothetical protein
MKALLGVCALALIVLAGLAGYDRWEIHQARVKAERAAAWAEAEQTAYQEVAHRPWNEPKPDGKWLLNRVIELFNNPELRASSVAVMKEHDDRRDAADLKRHEEKMKAIDEQLKLRVPVTR